MLSNLFRQQARLALATRSVPHLNRHCSKSLLSLSTPQKSLSSQRAFSICRALNSDASPAVEREQATSESEAHNAESETSTTEVEVSTQETATFASEAATPASEFAASTPESATSTSGFATSIPESATPTSGFAASTPEPVSTTREGMERSTENNGYLVNILYVNNIPWSVDEGELKELFADYGEIRRANIPVDLEGRSMGYGFVDFYDAADATRVLESNQEEPFVIRDRPLAITPAKRQVRAPRGPGEPNKTLHITNYPFPGDEAPLRKLFGIWQDKITRINFIKDQYGNPTSKTFVQFPDLVTSEAVLAAYQDAELAGVPLKFFYAQERNERRYHTRQRRVQRYDA